MLPKHLCAPVWLRTCVAEDGKRQVPEALQTALCFAWLPPSHEVAVAVLLTRFFLSPAAHAASYPEHFSAVGANAIAIYDAANCWVQDVSVTWIVVAS